MASTILLLQVASALKIITLPKFSVNTLSSIWPLPLFYVGKYQMHFTQFNMYDMTFWLGFDRQYGVWSWRYQSPISADVDGAEAFLHPHDNGRGVGDVRHQVWSLIQFFLPSFTLIWSGFITASIFCDLCLRSRPFKLNLFFYGFYWNSRIFSKIRSISKLIHRNIKVFIFKSYNSIKLLTFNHCYQTPLRRSDTNPKPICHFNPLLPRIVYVALLFDSCIPLWVMVPNLKRHYWKYETRIFLAETN